MFIRPNEFEALLTPRTAAPTFRRAHRAAGSAFLLALAPVMLAWLAFLACWIVGTALLRGPARIVRFLRDAADYAGWLVLR